MLSQHRNTHNRAANAIPVDHILDCAYDLLLQVGIQRLNMAEIARKAGISRATLYRRWPNTSAVTAALVTREFAALAARTQSNARTGRRRLVSVAVRLVGALREHPLLCKIVEVDPEFLLPYLLRRRGSSTEHQLVMIEDGLRAGIADGSIRRRNTALMARSVLLTAMSFALSGCVMADAVTIQALDAELADILDRYLAP